MARTPPNTKTFDDDSSSDNLQPTGDAAHDVSMSSRAPRAAKSKASAAWKELTKNTRNGPAKTNAGKSEKLADKKTKDKGPKPKLTQQTHRAPAEISLDTDSDSDETVPTKTPAKKVGKKEAASAKRETTSAKANKSTTSSTGMKSNKTKTQKDSESEEGSEDDGREEEDKESESSSSESGLGELEDKDEELQALLDTEDPKWADNIEDTIAEDEANVHPPENRDLSIRSNSPSRSGSHCDVSSTPSNIRAKRPRSKSSSEVPSAKLMGKRVARPPKADKDDDELETGDGLEDENVGGDEGAPEPKKRRKDRQNEENQRKKYAEDKARDKSNGKPKDKSKDKGKTKAKPSPAQPREEVAGAGGSSRKGKRKYDKDIFFVDSAPSVKKEAHVGAGVSSKRQRKQHRARDDSDSDSELASDEYSEDDCIDLVVESGKSRANLKEQRPRVRRVATHAIRELEIQLCLVHSFPESVSGSEFVRRALATAAKAVGDSELRKIIKDDRQKAYWNKLGSIPLQRISLFRGRVKKTTDNMVRSFFGLIPGDVDKVRLLQDGVGYIYPFDGTNKTFQGDKAFSPRIFEEALQTHFFSKPRSFGWDLIDQFTSSLSNKPDEKEIPAAMLALVSTANMDMLTQIKDGAPGAYYDIMHGLFVRIIGGVHGSQSMSKSYLDVTAMAHRSVSG